MLTEFVGLPSHPSCLYPPPTEPLLRTRRAQSAYRTRRTENRKPTVLGRDQEDWGRLEGGYYGVVMRWDRSVDGNR